MVDIVIFFGLGLILLIAVISYFTNPFSRFSIVKDPNHIQHEHRGMFKIIRTGELNVRSHSFIKKSAKVKSGWHIVSGRFIGGKKANGDNLESIIKEIHKARFDPKNPFIISGDHFSMLYPRSLGIFYHTLLDNRTAHDVPDWENRQQIYAKTTSYALEVFSKAKTQATTVVPVGRKSVVLMSIHTYPSDTLYSLLYALRVLSGKSQLQSIYKFKIKNHLLSQTNKVGQELIQKHKTSLKFLTDRYFDFVFDRKTGLIREDRLLSGTKDMAMRKSAFYDNIALWKLLTDAQYLGVIKKDASFLSTYKKQILDSFWNKQEGYFNEDMNSDAQLRYSSDWLIAYQTGFISPYNKYEQAYFTESVSYIQQNSIDQPFPLKYHNDYRPEQLYFWVKHSAKKYGSTTIWSHWGIEYIKLLIALSTVISNKEYLAQAKTFLDRYEFNIVRYKGYPELYNEQGDIYKTLFYKSVVKTGWVVNYEQAVAMYNWAKKQI